jgi:AraC family transcriptional regulator
VAVPNTRGILASCTAAAQNHPSDRYLAVAAQLVEAACCARVGNGPAAQSHIGNALALLEGRPNLPPAVAGFAGKNARGALRGGLAPWQARRITAHIDANLAGPIRIRDLAALVDFSTSHFCRTFKCTFGTSARAWIGRRRIEISQALMISTRAPLSEIAFSCGMSDQSHFTRAFRRFVGETPHSWRQLYRGAAEDHVTDLIRPREPNPLGAPQKGDSMVCTGLRTLRA